MTSTSPCPTHGAIHHPSSKPPVESTLQPPGLLEDNGPTTAFEVVCLFLCLWYDIGPPHIDMLFGSKLSLEADVFFLELLARWFIGSLQPKTVQSCKQIDAASWAYLQQSTAEKLRKANTKSLKCRSQQNLESCISIPPKNKRLEPENTSLEKKEHLLLQQFLGSMFVFEYVYCAYISWTLNSTWNVDTFILKALKAIPPTNHLSQTPSWRRLGKLQWIYSYPYIYIYLRLLITKPKNFHFGHFNLSISVVPLVGTCPTAPQALVELLDTSWCWTNG